MNYKHAEVATLSPQMMRTLCEEYIANNYIDPETSERLGVKRGLRNPDGTGVLAGLTNVCDVVGYKKDQEGHVIPTPGKLIYRGVPIDEIVDEAYRNDRFVFEEVIWLLLFGSLPTREQLDDFCDILAEHRALPQGIKLFFTYIAFERRLVCFIDMVRGRDKAVGKVAVVGDYQKPRCVLVEPAGGEKSAPAELERQEIDDRRAVGILCGTEHAGGLVEHDIEISTHGDNLSAYFKLVGIDIDLFVGCEYFFAVHLDRAASYELPCAAAGNIHLLCNCFIEPVQCGAPFFLMKGFYHKT